MIGISGRYRIKGWYGTSERVNILLKIVEKNGKVKEEKNVRFFVSGGILDERNNISNH